VRDGLAATLVTLAAEEVGQLLLQRLLQDQPRAEPADRLDRVQLLAGTTDHVFELTAQPLTRGYARHPGVPPRRLPGQRGGYARFISPGSRDATPAGPVEDKIDRRSSSPAQEHRRLFDDLGSRRPGFLEAVAVDTHGRGPTITRLQREATVDRQPHDVGKAAVFLRVPRDDKQAAARPAAHAATA
jgi:hypothetical protein